MTATTGEGPMPGDGQAPDPGQENPQPIESATEPPPDAAAFEEQVRLAEALIFAAAEPVLPRALTHLLDDATDTDAVIAALQIRYADRGVRLVEVGGGWQFRTAPDLAPRLRRVVQVPRRLPRVAMETLAIVAYHQPVTRPEIEEIRGASLSQATLDALLEANLIAPRGRKETPGRPTLWGTTPAFLAQFGLKDIRELPRREDLLVEPQGPDMTARPEGQPASPDTASPDTASPHTEARPGREVAAPLSPPPDTPPSDTPPSDIPA